MTEHIVILSTCASEAEARKLAAALLEAHLAACVNVLPGCQSYYRWKGAIEESHEWLLLIKSSRAQFAAVTAAIGAAHSYEVPEVIALPIIDGSANYLNWLRANLEPGLEGEA
jgi:periplasmic divalent cation tolerance protein